MKKLFRLSVMLLSALLMGICTACENNGPDLPGSGDEPLMPANPNAACRGFYLLNEGVWGANKATLDYFDYTTGFYANDVFAKNNPAIVGQLGDNGVDIQQYGSKIYVLLNGSNLVEIMDAHTAKHITAVEIPNVRSVCFAEGKAYFSSYAGKLLPTGVQEGYVVEMDTLTFALERTAPVGRQPEGLAVYNDKLYVANSGGYTADNYDNTISVIDMATFQPVDTIEVAINLQYLFFATDGTLYVSSRGNYMDIKPSVCLVDVATRTIKKVLDCNMSSVSVVKNNAYVMDFSYGATSVRFWTIDLQKQELSEAAFGSKIAAHNILYPYALAVHPVTGDVLVTDAVDFVTPGMLYYFDAQGNLLWKKIAGDIPGHILFLH